MQKTFLSVLFVCMVSVLAGCQFTIPKEELVQSSSSGEVNLKTGANLIKTTKTDDQISATTGSEVLSETNEMGVEIKNSEVFSHGEKRGWIEGNRVFINSEDNLYSFEFNGNVEMLNIPSRVLYDKTVFDYNGLKIKQLQETEIKYQCGQLFSAFTKTAVDCETNGKDFLSQYEYDPISPMTPEIEGHFYPMPWRWIFVKKVNGIDVIFEGDLEGIFASTYHDLMVKFYKYLLSKGLIEGMNITDEEEKDREVVKEKVWPKSREVMEFVSSEDFLRVLQKDSINIENKKNWKKIIESFQVKNTDI